jgi:hypothetical protein
MTNTATETSLPRCTHSSVGRSEVSHKDDFPALSLPYGHSKSWCHRTWCSCVVRFRQVSFIGVLLAMVSWPVYADTVKLTAIDAGHYSAWGFHDPDDVNITIGTDIHGVQILDESTAQHIEEWRNWLVFDLSAVTGTIHGAALTLSTAFVYREIEYLDPALEPITYTLFDVETRVTDVMAGGVDRTAIFRDLGTGQILGARQYTDADRHQIQHIGLNSAGLAVIEGALGTRVVLGGASTTFLPDRERLLSFSLEPRQLILEVPETASATLLLPGLLGIAVVAFLRRFDRST